MGDRKPIPLELIFEPVLVDEPPAHGRSRGCAPSRRGPRRGDPEHQIVRLLAATAPGHLESINGRVGCADHHLQRHARDSAFAWMPPNDPAAAPTTSPTSPTRCQLVSDQAAGEQRSRHAARRELPDLDDRVGDAVVVERGLHRIDHVRLGHVREGSDPPAGRQDRSSSPEAQTAATRAQYRASPTPGDDPPPERMPIGSSGAASCDDEVRSVKKRLCVRFSVCSWRVVMRLRSGDRRNVGDRGVLRHSATGHGRSSS